LTGGEKSYGTRCLAGNPEGAVQRGIRDRDKIRIVKLLEELREGEPVSGDKE
jgi:hypothetical protein